MYIKRYNEIVFITKKWFLNNINKEFSLDSNSWVFSINWNFIKLLKNEKNITLNIDEKITDTEKEYIISIAKDWTERHFIYSINIECKVFYELSFDFFHFLNSRAFTDRMHHTSDFLLWMTFKYK